MDHVAFLIKWKSFFVFSLRMFIEFEVNLGDDCDLHSLGLLVRRDWRIIPRRHVEIERDTLQDWVGNALRTPSMNFIWISHEKKTSQFDKLIRALSLFITQCRQIDFVSTTLYITNSFMNNSQLYLDSLTATQRKKYVKEVTGNCKNNNTILQKESFQVDLRVDDVS